MDQIPINNLLSRNDEINKIKAILHDLELNKHNFKFKTI